MRVRPLLSSLLSVFVLLALFPSLASAQDEMARDEPATDQHDIVKNALSAAPAAIAGDATVADWDGNVLRVGMNGYTCLPDDPETPGNSPMCLDEAWMAWADAWMNQEDPPAPEAMAFGYMLQGDFPVSNIDPYAEGPTENNEWIEDSGPHIMVLAPDPAMFDGITTDPDDGGPWVMWKDTPYVHLMIPTAKK